MAIYRHFSKAWSTLPPGVFALFCIQIFATLSFSVLYSTLVLYMSGALSLSSQDANSIMGVFVSFNYALHLLGGYWGGRFLSYRSLFCFGMFAEIVGCIFLTQINVAYLYYGLAIFLSGAGLNVTCLNCMLTQRFSAEDRRRESAFLYNYAAMNIGFLIGYSISGYFQLEHNYYTLFLLSSLGNVLAIILCLYSWKSLADIKTGYSVLNKNKKIQASIFSLILLCFLPILLMCFLQQAFFANQLVLAVGVLMLLIIYILASKQKTRPAKEKIFAFIVLMLAATVFWVLFQIGPMGLTYFIEYNVLRQWHNYLIAPQWFQNINTFCIIMGGPLMSALFTAMRKKGIAITIPMQFSLALLLIGLAFLVLPLGISLANMQGLVAAHWVILSFILQSFGELLISPIGYAMIGAIVPSSLQGLLMGTWMFSIGVGATLSSFSSNWMTLGQKSNHPLLTNAGYSHVFLVLGLSALITGLLLFCLKPKLQAWMHDSQ